MICWQGQSNGVNGAMRVNVDNQGPINVNVSVENMGTNNVQVQVQTTTAPKSYENVLGFKVVVYFHSLAAFV